MDFFDAKRLVEIHGKKSLDNHKLTVIFHRMFHGHGFGLCW